MFYRRIPFHFFDWSFQCSYVLEKSGELDLPKREIYFAPAGVDKSLLCLVAWMISRATGLLSIWRQFNRQLLVAQCEKMVVAWACDLASPAYGKTSENGIKAFRLISPDYNSLSRIMRNPHFQRNV